MKIITAKQGDSYEQVEMDIRAIFYSSVGDQILDKNNCLKFDTEIHFIRKPPKNRPRMNK